MVRLYICETLVCKTASIYLRKRSWHSLHVKVYDQYVVPPAKHRYVGILVWAKFLSSDEKLKHFNITYQVYCRSHIGQKVNTSGYLYVMWGKIWSKNQPDQTSKVFFITASPLLVRNGDWFERNQNTPKLSTGIKSMLPNTTNLAKRCMFQYTYHALQISATQSALTLKDQLVAITLFHFLAYLP